MSRQEGIRSPPVLTQSPGSSLSVGGNKTALPVNCSPSPTPGLHTQLWGIGVEGKVSVKTGIVGG